MTDLLLDRQQPTFESRLFVSKLVDAPPDRTYAAVRALKPDDVAQSFPPMRVLGRLRALPARVARRGSPPPEGTLTADEANDAFVVLAEQPGEEVVIGMIGKFMTATQLEFRRTDPVEFAGFAEPGYGKVALNFRVEPYGPGRSILTTETRTVTTDPVSAARFRRYWRLVGPFAGVIMRRWLRLAAANAENDRIRS